MYLQNFPFFYVKLDIYKNAYRNSPSSEFCVKLALFLFVSHKLGARCKLCNKMQRIAQETTKCLSCIYAIAIGGNKEILKEV